MNYSALDAVCCQLQSAPPRFAVDPMRQQLLLQIDKLLSEADSETDFELGRFYRDRVDQIIREVKAYTGDNPRLWKLYSSGFLLKDHDRVIAIDINGGCTPDSGRTRMILHDAQFEALSDIIDEYYNTHSHRDHISADLCDLLAAKGKLIVIEGTDCSGKETQSRALVDNLNKIGKKAVRLSFPRYESPTGQIIGGAFLGKENINIPPVFPEKSVNVPAKVASLFYAADRCYNKNIIEDYLKNGHKYKSNYIFGNIKQKSSHRLPPVFYKTPLVKCPFI